MRCSLPHSTFSQSVAPTRHFQQIGRDLLGRFPASTTSNWWIIGATDYFTRYAEKKGLPRGNAAEVTKSFVENTLLRHGAPEVLITDRTTVFAFELIQAILQYSETNYLNTTAYRP